MTMRTAFFAATMALMIPGGLAVSVGMTTISSSALAQGIPVIDTSAIAKMLEQIAQGKDQITQLKAQLEQAEQLYGSLNGLTNMSDVVSSLNDPAIRKVLPKDFAEYESVLTGNGSGKYGESAQKFLEQNTTYQIDANEFYAQELTRIQKQNAGQMSLAEQIYDAATKRLDGIDDLRKEISKSENAKDTADLTARLQAEAAMLQADQLRMQSIVMLQQAQSQVQEQREKEDFLRGIDAQIENLERGLQ